MKEKGKIPEKELNKMEISNLSDKKIQSSVNKPERKVYTISENFNRDGNYFFKSAKIEKYNNKNEK